MKAVVVVHVIVVWLLTLGLAALCWWQWRGSAELAHDLRESRDEAASARLEADLQTQRADRLTGNLIEAEAEAIAQRRATDRASDRVLQLKAEQKVLSKQIAVLGDEVERSRQRIEQSGQVIEGFVEVEAALAERDEIIRRLEAERVELAEELNSRTRLFNELVKQVNGG